MGSNSFLPSNETSQTLQLTDDVTKIYGKHTFKMGFEWQHVKFTTLQPPWSHGEFDYNGAFTDVPAGTSGNTGRADFLLTPTLSTVPGGINYVGPVNIGVPALVNVSFQNSGTVSCTVTLYDAGGTPLNIPLPANDSVLIKKAFIKQYQVTGAGATILGVISWPFEVDLSPPPSLPAGSGTFSTTTSALGVVIAYYSQWPGASGDFYLSLLNASTSAPAPAPRAMLLYFSTIGMSGNTSFAILGTGSSPASTESNLAAAIAASAYLTNGPTNTTGYFSVLLAANQYMAIFDSYSHNGSTFLGVQT